ncbi:MAG TPA: hypothetical protein VJX67_22880 [Blastocatellia bacterium]|nr:hypothetical protein [Blastocatellia bacterium]
MFRPRVWWVVLTGVLLTAGSIAAFGSGAVFWEVTKQEDIAKGDAQGVSIRENGVITLAPAYELVYDTKEAYVWSSAIDVAGNVYLGTGHEGRIFKVTPDGQGKLLYDSPELDVTALAVDQDGNVYAGTSPDGKIYKIGPDGKESVFYDPPDKYIWSLVYDQKTATLYAGTGNKGIVYKIDSTGKASTLATTTETNIVSLALDKNGDLIAGTDPSGLVLRISPAGKTFALLDSPLQEIHSLAIAADGSIYALGINQSGTQPHHGNIGTSSTTAVTSEGVITISTDDSESTSQTTSSTTDLSGLIGQGKSQSHSADGAKSAVIRILPDGSNEAVWTSRDTLGFAFKLLPDGQLLVGTGVKGRIYSVAKNYTSTLLIQSHEDQTSTILGSGDNLYATSSNLGKLYRIGRQTVTEGTYVSPTRDAKFVSAWGMINWRGSGSVELQTRTGNTENPDATWSEWSAPYRDPRGEQITSQRARFIQWRATLRSSAARAQVSGGTRRGASSDEPEGSGVTAQLQSVTIAYLPKNQPPEISSATVLPSGIALQEMPIAVDPSVASSGLDPALFGVSVNVPPRRYYQKGARSLVWQASDPNEDTLVYRLYYRSINDTDWHLLADNLSNAYYTLDGNRLPDGTYVFKVVASDSPSNPEALALTAEYTTEAVELDNTPPTIKSARPSIVGHAADVVFDAIDSTSRILRGEYSVDGGPWQLVFPEDGVADSPHEVFDVKVTLAAVGEHVVAFRCSDSSSNVGTSKVTVIVR